MIRVSLQGKLGNWLFQYAAARALALRHRTGLVLDTRKGRQGQRVIVPERWFNDDAMNREAMRDTLPAHRERLAVG